MGVTWPWQEGKEICQFTTDPKNVGSQSGDRETTYDHGVEGETRHCRDADALASSPRVEDLGRDDPAEWAARTAEAEVVEPRHDDEAPLCARVGRHARRILGQQDRGHDEGDHVAEIAIDQGPATSRAVDEEDRAELGDQRDDAVDALVLEGVITRDPCVYVVSMYRFISLAKELNTNRSVHRWSPSSIESPKHQSSECSLAEHSKGRACGRPTEI